MGVLWHFVIKVFDGSDVLKKSCIVLSNDYFVRVISPRCLCTMRCVRLRFKLQRSLVGSSVFDALCVWTVNKIVVSQIATHGMAWCVYLSPIIIYFMTRNMCFCVYQQRVQCSYYNKSQQQHQPIRNVITQYYVQLWFFFLCSTQKAANEHFNRISVTRKVLMFSHFDCMRSTGLAYGRDGMSLTLLRVFVYSLVSDSLSLCVCVRSTYYKYIYFSHLLLSVWWTDSYRFRSHTTYNITQLTSLKDHVVLYTDTLTTHTIIMWLRLHANIYRCLIDHLRYTQERSRSTHTYACDNNIV